MMSWPYRSDDLIGNFLQNSSKISRRYLRAHNDGVAKKIRKTRDTMVYILVLFRKVNGLKTDLFPPLGWGSNIITVTSACHFN